jgi:hypothetical protein
MKRLPTKTTLLVLGIIVAVGMLTAAAVALAASPKVTTATPAAAKTNGPSKYCTGFIGHLAGDLGKSQSNVGNAINKALGQTLADAVKNGDLTQAQATKLQNQLTQSGGACAALSRLKGQFSAGALSRPGVLSFGIDAAASAFKITTTELRQDIAKGMTLHLIADSKGVTEDQLKASVKASLTQKLDQAVQNGKLNKAQEAKILAGADQVITMFWDRSRPAAK